jgi:hypothetical protein
MKRVWEQELTVIAGPEDRRGAMREAEHQWRSVLAEKE